MDEWTIVIMVLCSLSIVSGTGVFGYWLKLRHQHRHMPRIVEQLEEMRRSVGELRSGVPDNRIARAPGLC